MINFKEYIRNNPKGYWFKRKLYGWGWFPVKWEGAQAQSLRRFR